MKSNRETPWLQRQKKRIRANYLLKATAAPCNFSDSEIVASILSKEGFNTTQKLEEADLVLVNTCSIR